MELRKLPISYDALNRQVFAHEEGVGYNTKRQKNNHDGVRHTGTNVAKCLSPHANRPLVLQDLFCNRIEVDNHNPYSYSMAESDDISKPRKDCET